MKSDIKNMSLNRLEQVRYTERANLMVSPDHLKHSFLAEQCSSCAADLYFEHSSCLAAPPSVARLNRTSGFTLVELMLVVVIVAIFAAIAIPSYQAYIRKSDAAAVKQEMLRLSEQLERYKSRNFSYHGFDPYYLYNVSTGISSINFPTRTGATQRYTITLADISSGADDGTLLSSNTSGLGQQWAIKAVPVNVKYEAFLLKGTGVRCKTVYYSSSDLVDLNKYSGCGSSSESW